MRYLYYKTILRVCTLCLKMRNAYVESMGMINETVLNLYACLLCMS